jgi:type VII secretion-associated serine protease mycosin
LFMVVALSSPGMAAAFPKPLPTEWWFTSWGIEDRVWPITQGQGVTVAVLDTGVEASIPDMSPVVLPGTDETGGSGDGRTDLDTSAVPGHGTGMASLIASQGTHTGFVGVAPRARILPVVIQGLVGAAAGIRYAVDHGAKVINISQAAPSACPDDVQKAVGYALQHDVVVVAGAGNDGDASNPSVYPANCAGVLAVGAVDSRTVPWSKTQRQPYVTVAAPGVAMVHFAKDGEVHTVDGGTSPATALVSGAAALVRSKFPKMPAREVVQRLIASARDSGPKGKDELTGYGIIRPVHALLDNVPKSAPNPVFDGYDKWAAANGGSNATGSHGTSAASDGPNWGRIATLVIGLIVVVAIIVGAMVFLRRGRRPQAPGGQPYGQQGTPPYGGPYQQSGPPPGAQPHYYPPAGGSPQGGQAPPQGQYPPPGQPGQWDAPDHRS